MSSKIGYFSMETAMHRLIPTYSGGLGVLAGDTIRGAAELRIPMVAVTLFYKHGYFRQELDENGRQVEKPRQWDPQRFLTELPERVSVTIEGREVQIGAWKFDVKAPDDFTIPIYLLDTDLPENAEQDRALTHHLYGGDSRHRLCQEVVLGIGGVRMLRAQGHDNITSFHMNEGHSALLTLELMDEAARDEGREQPGYKDIETVRRQCVFTTHTPVPAGHDRFPVDLAMSVLGRDEICRMQEVFCYEGMLNMTYVGLNLSDYVNGVAKKHAEVSRLMFADYSIDAITNGVHVPTWTSPPFAQLFDRHMPSWREDSFMLRSAFGIPPDEIWEAHQQAKRNLIEHVNYNTEAGMQTDVLTLGFARRATAYKRADLMLHDPERLKRISSDVGRLQIIYAGKAHPADEQGKQQIMRIFEARKALAKDVNIVYLEDYNWDLGALMTAGVDVWVNTPHPPQEASGTSGMKSAANGVPSLSILDGWWIEGCFEGRTGWAIDPGPVDEDSRTEADAKALYDKLESEVVPTYYHDRERFIEIMTYAIVLNGSFFSTQRMMLEYFLKAYSVRSRPIPSATL